MQRMGKLCREARFRCIEWMSREKFSVRAWLDLPLLNGRSWRKAVVEDWELDLIRSRWLDLPQLAHDGSG
jgi:hypothetical protein